MSNADSKRIAKNTVFLYVRMLVIICVNLYTSRVILEALGIDDYGIYSVVGGFVAMFTLISGSISAAISRYLTFELGTGNKDRLNLIFSTSVTVLLIISGIIILLAESLGLWFINQKMTFPKDSMVAVNVVFQISVLNFIIKLLSQPYNAAIISHEKMSAFAYISVIEAIGSLAIAFIIMLNISEKLIVYAILMCILTMIIRIIYTKYCKDRFQECNFSFSFNISLLKEMFSFAGWNFIGASSSMLRDQGGNIVINIYYGAAVNAATGIATQVSHAINGFVTNFMTAMNPQITKSYAIGDYSYMRMLVIKGSKFSFFLLLILSSPVIINIDYILQIWLVQTPPYTSIFIRLILFFALSESISQPLVTVMLATGKIKYYQIVVGGLQMLNLPISYLLLKSGYAPQYVYIVAIILSQICMFARLGFMKAKKLLNIVLFLKNVYSRIVIVFALSFGIIIIQSFPINNIIHFIGYTLIYIAWTTMVVYVVGLNKQEKRWIIAKGKSLISKIRKS